MNLLNLFKHNRQPANERDLHPFSKEEWESVEIDTHPGEPFDNPDFPMNVGSGEHEGQFYCGICGWVDIDLFPHCH